VIVTVALHRKTLSVLLVSASIAFQIGCSGGQDSQTDDLVVDVQGLVQNDSVFSVPVDEKPLGPVCTGINSDPDGDGWGWENQRSCIASPLGATADTVSVDTRNDLPVGIVYFLWHCVTKTAAHNNEYNRLNLAPGEELNSTNVLNGQQSDWGNRGRFHWWDEPEEGYYCLGNRPDVIQRHLELLRDAGIDYLVLDMTNHPNTESLEADTFILKSLRPLLEMARSVPNAPRIVPWVPLASENAGTNNELSVVCNANPAGEKCQRLENAPAQSMYQHVTSLLQNEYPELTFEYQGKPLLLAAANDNKYPRAETDVVSQQLEASWTVRRMWGLLRTNNDWQFLTTCSNPNDFFDSRGWTANGCNQPINAGEQISVTAAYQYTYISEPFTENARSHAGFTGGMPKFQGRTLAQQFRVAFDHRDQQPMVLLTGWNEWIASRHDLQDRVAFVDVFDNSRNRDIEPGGESGDLYYYLMRDLITQYRNNKPFVFEDYFLTETSIFDANFYWQTYTDLQSTFQAGDVEGLRNHWLTSGLQEGRRPSILFDANYYRDRYPALANQGITTTQALLQHFIDSGFQEGRQGSREYHSPVYVNRYPEVAELFGDNGYYKAFKYYQNIGQLAPKNHNPQP